MILLLNVQKFHGVQGFSYKTSKIDLCPSNILPSSMSCVEQVKNYVYQWSTLIQDSFNEGSVGYCMNMQKGALHGSEW